MSETSEKPRSHAELMLEAFKKAIDDYATGSGQRSVSIGGVSFQYSSLDELFRLKSYYEAEVRREKGVKLYRIGHRFPC